MRDTELPCKENHALSTSEPRLNFTNSFPGESSLPISFAASWCPSSFGNHVGRVIGIRAQEEMLWISTRRVIAAMENAFSFRNTSKVPLPDQTMHPIFSALKTSMTVTTIEPSASPNKAFTLLLEAIFNLLKSIRAHYLCLLLPDSSRYVIIPAQSSSLGRVG